MSLFINQHSGPIYSECNVTIINGQTSPQQPAEVEDVTPQEQPANNESIIFTQKAKTEHKEADITAALQRSLSGRNDKARALVEEVRQWQKDGYIDPNFNARVMYGELNKILTLPFQYDGFRKYYNE